MTDIVVHFIDDIPFPGHCKAVEAVYFHMCKIDNAGAIPSGDGPEKCTGIFAVYLIH